jgi:AcrR family transcriptional regulator
VRKPLNNVEKQMESPFNKHYLREQKRRAILSEAARLFNIHGARATRLSDVAESLELNKASLYYYIKSKDDLIYQTYQASCDTIEALLDRAETLGRSGREKLVWFIRSYFEAWQAIMLGERPQFAMLTEIRALNPVHRKRVADRYRALFGRIKAFIHEGTCDSSLLPCQETDVALALFGLVQLTVLWLPNFEPADTGRAADDFIDIVLHGVAADRTLNMKCVHDGTANLNGDSPDAQRSARQEGFCRVGSAFFNRKGFKGTSLDDIADELAVTKGAFYYNVKDKDDLLLQCFERSLDLMARIQEHAGAYAEDGLQALQRCASRLFEIQTGEAGPLIRFNLIPSLSAQNKNQILTGIERVSDRFGAMIETGIEDGSIRAVNPYIAEQLLMSAIDLSSELPWMRALDDREEACRSYFRFYFNGLANTPG